MRQIMDMDILTLSVNILVLLVFYSSLGLSIVLRRMSCVAKSIFDVCYDDYSAYLIYIKCRKWRHYFEIIVPCCLVIIFCSNNHVPTSAVRWLTIISYIGYALLSACVKIYQKRRMIVAYIKLKEGCFFGKI